MAQRDTLPGAAPDATTRTRNERQSGIDDTRTHTPRGTAAGPAALDVHGRPAMTRLGFVVSIVLLALTAIGLAFHDIDSTDIWMHMAAGEDILTERRVPHVDPFAAADQAQPWINTQWLSDVGLALLQRLGGAPALVLWSCVVAALLVLLPLHSAVRQSGPRTLLLVGGVLSLLIVHERFLVRPELTSLLALVVLHAFLRRRPTWSRRQLVLLFLAQVLWTNTHPAFLLGPALVLLSTLDRAVLRWRRPADRIDLRASLLALGTTVVACCINPWGVRLPWHALSAVRDLSQAHLRQGIVEWQPTFSSAPWSDLTLLGFVAALLWSVPALWAARRHATLYEVLVFVLLTALALQARRHLALYAVVVPPWLALQTTLAWPSAPSPRRWVGALAHGSGRLAVLVLLVVLALDTWRGTFYERFGPPRSRGMQFSEVDHPIAAIETYRTLGRPQPLFNNVAAGSALLWLDQGRSTPFIDGRLLSADDFRSYRSLLASPQRFNAAHRQHGWRAVLLALQPYAPIALFRSLVADPDWHLMQLDATGALFVHRTHLEAHDTATAGLDLERPLPALPHTGNTRDGFWSRCDPGPMASRGALLLELGYPEAARADLAQAYQQCTQQLELGLLLSSALIDVGRIDAAVPVVERILRAEPGRAEAWTNLGRIHWARGETEQAQRCWKQATELIPPDPAATEWLERVPPPTPPSMPQRPSG